MDNKWNINTQYATNTRFKRFRKNHEKEYVSCFSNLEKIIGLLNSGKSVALLANNPSFFRSEGGGLFRIGQTCVIGAKESRLYVYPDETTKAMFILDIGTKENQQQDIITAKTTIRQLHRELHLTER